MLTINCRKSKIGDTRRDIVMSTFSSKRNKVAEARKNVTTREALPPFCKWQCHLLCHCAFLVFLAFTTCFGQQVANAKKQKRTVT